MEKKKKIEKLLTRACEDFLVTKPWLAEEKRRTRERVKNSSAKH
jgi:hypothetical protein